MHHVGWCSRVGDDHVDIRELVHWRELVLSWDLVWILVGQLQESLQTSARVLWAHALVAVRQQHDEAGLTSPFGLTRRNELVNNALSSVGKVAELGLPNDQRVGIGQRVAELEAQNGKLGQRAVADCIVGLVDGQMVERHIAVQVLVLVVDDVVTVTERTTLDVLTTQTDMGAFDEQRAEGHGLTESPVSFAGLDQIAAVLEHTSNARMNGEPIDLGLFAELLSDLGERLLGDTGVWVWEGSVALEEFYKEKIK